MKSVMLKYLPNTLTVCNMVIGILAVCLMIHNRTLSGIKLACYLIYVAVIFDMLDGHLARYFNTSSQFGKQLDSFADFVTFGIAPVVVFISNMKYVPWYIMIIVLIYPLAGVFRLARYNLQESSEYYIGLPITASGFIMVSVLLINSYIHSEYTWDFVIFYMLLAIFLSVMMVSNFRVNRIVKVNSEKDNINITIIK